LETNGSEHPALQAREISASLNGAPARVVRVLGPQHDMLLLLLLDLTEDLSLAQLAKQTLATELEKLPAHIYVTVLRASDGLRVLADPSAERAPLMAAIRELPVSGKAGLLESLPAALKLAEVVLGKAAVRVGLLYVSDSSIYNYRDDYINPVINYSDRHDLSRRFPEVFVKEKISRLERQLAALESPLFIVHLSYRNDRLNEAYQTGLMQLAAALGGSARFCRSRQEISGQIAGALERLAAVHRVDLEVPPRAGKFATVQLEAPGRPLVYRNRFALEAR